MRSSHLIPSRLAEILLGIPSYARGRFEQVAEHEGAHVQFLEAALGDKATKKCTYELYDLSLSFSYSNTFLVLAPIPIPRNSLL